MTSENNNRSEWLLLLIVGLLLAPLLYAWAASYMGLNKHYDVAATPVSIPDGPEAVREGERLARIRGCFWCHGQTLEGQKYFAEADRGLIVVAPDLTRVLAESTPAEFARTVRHGIKKDGTSVQPAMPSFAFYNMSDADMGLIMAYIKSLPMQNGFAGEFRLMPLGWFRWLPGELPPNVAELIDHDAPRPDPALNGTPVERGRYLALSVCTECHGDNGRLRVPITPDLDIAAAYTREQFHRLMRTGVPLGERKIDYHMVDVSKYRYIEMHAAEVDALYDYFRAQAGLPAD